MTMTDHKTILVLGGGVGGLVSAVELRKRLPAHHRVVLIDRERDHLFQPSLLWLMTGVRKAKKIARPLASLEKRGIEVVRGEIERIDPSTPAVQVDGEELRGDFLIISLGAELAPDVVPGLAEAGHSLYTLDGAESLRESLRRFRSGRLVVLTAAPAYKCPAAPYEAAMLLEYDCRKRKVRGDVDIDLFAAEPGPMGVAGPEITAAVREMVEAKGIGYLPNRQVTSVDPAAKTLTFASGEVASFDLLAYVPPHRAPAVIREAGLVGDSGWIPVDRHTLRTGHPGVFAIGDVTGIPLALGKPLPMAGVFAHGQAEVVANNVAYAITGKGKTRSFDGHGECFIETGDGKAGFGKGDFYAEPKPQVAMHPPARRWHAGKVAFEKHWLWSWF